MKRYCPITIEEMRNHLKSDKGWVEEQNRLGEAVFTYSLKKTNGSIVIRVYSSINPQVGVSREAGEDAIRVCAVNTLNDRGFIKSARVYRTKNWRDNLQKRVVDTIKAAQNRWDGIVPRSQK